MITKLITTSLLLFTFFLNANSQTYNFSTYTNSYSDLESSISLNEGETWDDPSYSIPLSFNFQMAGNMYSTIYLDGEYGFGGLLTFEESKEATLPFLIAYGGDIIDRGYNNNMSESEISYLLTGEDGSQILKIEWKNVGFYTELDQDSISTSYTNFQLWLYEGFNNFEIHIGPNSITQPDLCYDGATGVTIGYVAEYNTETDTPIGEVLLLTGNPTAPDVNNTGNISTLSGTIPENTVYLFEFMEIVNIEEVAIANLDFVLSPNPATESFTIESSFPISEIESVSIITITGKLVVKTNLENGNFVDVSELTEGVYLVQIVTSDKRVITEKLVVK